MFFRPRRVAPDLRLQICAGVECPDRLDVCTAIGGEISTIAGFVRASGNPEKLSTGVRDSKSQSKTP